MKQHMDISNYAGDALHACARHAIRMVLIATAAVSTTIAISQEPFVPLSIAGNQVADTNTTSTINDRCAAAPIALREELSRLHPGIYYISDTGGLAQLPPGNARSINREPLMSFSSHKVLRLTGLSAPNQFDEVPFFYLRIDDQGAAFDCSAYALLGYPHIANPRDLELALLDPKADAREMETAVTNCFTYRSNIEPGRLRPFDIEQIAPGAFKVTVLNLVPGEYCFIYSGTAPGRGNQQRVYDFGIGTAYGRASSDRGN